MSDSLPPSAFAPTVRRAAKAAERRVRILEAALAEFSEKGFAAARMEDVARRAAVAKGTIYLHFADKQALFAAIVRREIVPAMERLAARELRPGESVRGYLKSVVVPIAASLLEPPRGDIIRLLLAEGPRFPELTELYFRDVVAGAMARVRALARTARARGEANAVILEQFPQLFGAPLILGILWSALFEHIEPLDVGSLLGAQIDLLFPGPAPAKPS